jgi:hypothetical protein
MISQFYFSIGGQGMYTLVECHPGITVHQSGVPFFNFPNCQIAEKIQKK